MLDLQMSDSACRGAERTGGGIMIFNRIYYGKEGKREQDAVVDLALATGDQTVIPAFGEVFSSVVIRQPETLVPSNIRQGITIAGVEGTLIPKSALFYAEGVRF